MIAGIIQDRMGSSRLPGKAMLPLAGKPMCYRVMERVKRAKKLDKVILATTELPEDDVICDVAKELNIEVFRGSENNLAHRYHRCARKFKVDVIVRICADNPLIEPGEIDRIIRYYLLHEHFEDSEYFLFSNTHNFKDNDYPDGLGAEVYSYEAIKRVSSSSFFLADIPSYKNKDYKEHPHKFFFERNDVSTIKCPENMRYPHLKLDVNDQKEYKFISSIFDKFGHNDFHFLDYVEDINNGKCNVQQHGAGNI